MEWYWRIEDGAHVLGFAPLPTGVLEFGFRGRLLVPGSPDPWSDRPQVRPGQVHGTQLAWARNPGSLAACDAVRTSRPGLLLTVRTADCLPLLLSSPGEGIALVHAGWRGLADGVVETAVATFVHPDRLQVVLGPAIGVCCFEVGEEVASRFPRSTGHRGGRIRPHVDLPAEARRRLLLAGVPEGRISPPAPCSRCHQHVLHSHRGSGGAPERIVAYASWNPPLPHPE
jgi:YfiH family protein